MAIILDGTNSDVGSVASMTATGNDLTLTTTTANAIKLSTSGVERARIHSNGGVSIGSTVNPGADNLDVAGNVYVGSQLLGQPNDGASYPSFTWNTDTNTGIWRPAAANIGFSTSGVEHFRIGPDGSRYIRQAAPVTKSAAATLTGAEMLSGIIQYTGAAATLTLPTAATMEAAGSWFSNSATDLSIINTGTGTVTIATGGFSTLIGAMTVTVGSSGLFRIRRATSAAYAFYRIG